MIAHALRGAGLEPGYLIGGALRSTGRNADWGTGEWLVVEADESDRSLLALDTDIAVLTNVELDHHAVFSSLEKVREVFREFLRGAPQAVLWDRPDVLSLREEAKPSSGLRSSPSTGQTERTIAYDVCEDEVTLSQAGCRFLWRGREVVLPVPGIHNARNACAALEACRLAGADLDAAAHALRDFQGAGRRFQILGRARGGAVIVDDYAHHPTEIAATLAAARTHKPRRLLAVFQPHLYSRTQHLAREFGEALIAADVVVVLGIYPAREKSGDFPGVSGRLIAAAASDAAPGKDVYWLPDMAAASKVLAELSRPGDLLLLLGAGNVTELGPVLVGS
jgi:UDP-N-acetylmuramate--alanine ligase